MLKILEQNVRKTRSIIIEIFAEPKIFDFNIITFQKPWRRLDYNSI